MPIWAHARANKGHAPRFRLLYLDVVLSGIIYFTLLCSQFSESTEEPFWGSHTIKHSSKKDLAANTQTSVNTSQL